MKHFTPFIAIVASLTLSSITVNASDEPEDMAILPAGEGREEVFYNCASCHSMKIVVQQGLSEAMWAKTLKWMVEEQEMAPLTDEDHAKILAYLVKHFGPDRKR